MDPNELADGHVEQAPPVTPGVAEADTEKRESIAREFEGKRDREGRRFDPDLHDTDAQGRPVLTKAGKLRMKPGRKKGPAGPASGATPNSTSGSVPPTGAARKGESEDYRALALLAVEQIVGLSQLLLGPDWRPREAEGWNEAQGMVDAWENWLREKGVSEISPTAMLIMTHVGYACGAVPNRRAELPDPAMAESGAVPRFLSPTTRERARAIWRGIRMGERFKSIFARFRRRGTRSDSGNGPERENESR